MQILISKHNEIKDLKNNLFIGYVILIVISGIYLNFLILLIIFQFRFILTDSTTSEFLRTDKYTENLNDEGCKKNFIKFLKGWENENDNDYIYNDQASELIMDNITIEKYCLELFINKNKDKNKNKENEIGEYGINRITRERLDSIISNNTISDKIEKMNFETEENYANGENSIN